MCAKIKTLKRSLPAFLQLCSNHENELPISVFVQMDPPVVQYSVSPRPQYQSDQGQKLTLHSCLGQELNLFRGTLCASDSQCTLYLFGGRG